MRIKVVQCFGSLVLLLSVAAGFFPSEAQLVGSGRGAGFAVGQLGQRQTRDATTSITVPTGRIDGRIPSRVQSRIRNRIDQNYNPQADTASSIAVAQDQVRRKKR
jgi:hypothetical protein